MGRDPLRSSSNKAAKKIAATQDKMDSHLILLLRGVGLCRDIAFNSWGESCFLRPPFRRHHQHVVRHTLKWWLGIQHSKARATMRPDSKSCSPSSSLSLAATRQNRRDVRGSPGEPHQSHRAGKRKVGRRMSTHTATSAHHWEDPSDHECPAFWNGAVASSTPFDSCRAVVFATACKVTRTQFHGGYHQVFAMPSFCSTVFDATGTSPRP